ncbi:MAG TPA: hypothetical protein DHV28_12365 [Ignavibacteriales bacterium]|nr:hypothetical protein [Ignavibacteriales bacterium]
MELPKKSSPFLFGLILLCFFLPFVNLSCSGQTIMSLTGFQLITGAEVKQPDMFGQNMMGQNDNMDKENEEVSSQPMALLAFIAALAALLISLMKKKTTALINIVISVLGVIFLFLLKFNIDGDAKLNTTGQGIITLDYQFGYWFSILLFIGGAVLSWLIFNEKLPKENVISEPPPAEV